MRASRSVPPKFASIAAQHTASMLPHVVSFRAPCDFEVLSLIRVNIGPNVCLRGQLLFHFPASERIISNLPISEKKTFLFSISPQRCAMMCGALVCAPGHCWNLQPTSNVQWAMHGHGTHTDMRADMPAWTHHDPRSDFMCVVWCAIETLGVACYLARLRLARRNWDLQLTMRFHAAKPADNIDS